MSAWAYYNEFDEGAAAWLRELIRQGFIADGVVDDRSITEVSPDDLTEFTQCHFFAGIGGWSLAARMAGIPDDFPLWSGSCPCQAFSDAGQKKGFDDERHLWPAFYRLIDVRRPPVVVGEQVEAAVRFGWLDLVQTDLEAADYAFGAASLCAAGVGAPHLRQRLYWGGILPNVPLGNSDSSRCRRRASCEFFGPSDGAGCCPSDGNRIGLYVSATWRGSEIRLGADGQARPIEPWGKPVAYGVPARLVRLRGYGNAIVPQVGAVFLTSLLEAAELR